MPLSSALAPGFVRIRYSGVNRPHLQVIPIKFATTPTPGIDPDLETSDGGNTPFSTSVNNYVANALAPSFNSDTVFGFADCYAVNATTGVRQFIFGVNMADLGSSADPQVPKVQGVFLFKTTNGKFLRVYTMEGVYDPDVRNIGTVPADGRQDMIDFVLSDDNIFYGRQNSFPLAFISFTSKVNDVLRRNQMPTV